MRIHRPLVKLSVVGIAISLGLLFQNCSPNSGASGLNLPSVKESAPPETVAEISPTLTVPIEQSPVQKVPTPTPKPATAPKLKIAMFGDSTMHGTTGTIGHYVQSQTNAPASFQKLLDTEYGPGVVVVKNEGIGGSYCSQWLNGSPTDAVRIDKTWKQQVASTDAKILVMNVGINDAYQVAPVQSQTDFQQCYYQLAKVAQDAGKIFVFQTPNPIFTAHAALVKQRRDDIVLVQSIFSGFPIIDIHSVKIDWEKHLPDQTHPDDEGYQIVGWHQFHVLNSVIAPLVK